MTTSCSVVVRCYNEERHIGRLLSGVVQQTVRDVELIVVDSGSTDATVAIASRYPVKVLSIAPSEFSFGRSLNLGLGAATRDFVVIASAHVYPVYRDWLESLLAPLTGPDTALVYGRQIGTAESKYSERQILAKWFPERSNLDQAHPFCNNANAAIRRSVWDVIPYDETLTGLEDTDWAKRAMQMGFKIAYEASAEVVHVHDESPRRIYNRYRREAIALKRISPEESFRFPEFVRLYIANVVSDLWHASRDRVLTRSSRSIAVFRLMQMWGTYRGFAQKGPVTGELTQAFYFPSRIRPQSAALGANRDERMIVDYSGHGSEDQSA